MTTDVKEQVVRCRMLSRSWETTKDITGQRFTAYKCQGTVTLSVRHEKAKTVSIT